MMKMSFMRSLLVVSVITLALLGYSWAEGETGEHGTPQPFFTGSQNMIFPNEEIKKATETKYYAYQVGSDWDSNKQHFTAVVHSEHPLSHFDVYISKSTKTPGPKDSDATTKKCQSFGHDVCFWPKNDIKPHDVITVGIHCWTNCHYTLELQVAEETFLEKNLNHKTVLHFGEKSSRIVKLHVPKNDDANHIVIQVNPLNAYLFHDKYDVFVNKGNDLPDSRKHDVTVTDSFGQGKAAIIYKNNGTNNLFCTDCNYTVEITAAQGAIFEIRTEVRGTIIPLKDHAFGAVLNSQNVLIYEFKPKDIPHYNRTFNDLKRLDLFIDIHSYSGTPNVYIHPNTRPNNLSEYKWKFIYNVHDMISLTQMERQQERATEEVYYIAVTAPWTSTFTLDIHYGKKEGHNVKFGVVERGELRPAEMVNFKLDVFVSKSLDFHVAMTKLGANATLIMKQCPRPLNKTTCMVTMADYQKIVDRKVVASDKLYSTTHSGRFETIDISLKETDCVIEKNAEQAGHLQTHGLTVGHCIYALAVYAPPTPPGKLNVNSPFAFLVYHPDHSHVLHEGSPFHASLEQYSNHLYSFTLPKDDSVTNVSFHLTPITGSPTLYVRRGAPNPDKNSKEKVAGWLNDRVLYTVDDTKGVYKLTNVTYYLKVEAEEEHSYYSVAAIVHRANQTFANHTHLVLREGVPFKYTMLSYDSEAYFKFSYYPTVEKSGLTLHLLALHGHFEMAIAKAKDLKDEFIPYQETVKNELHFDAPPKVTTTYIVRVRSVDPYNPEVQHFHNASRDNHTIMTHPQFSIYWKHDDTYTVLTEKNPHSGSIKPGEFQYFQIQIGAGDGNLHINRHAMNGQVEVYFSFKNSNQHPNAANSDGILTQTGSDVFPINEEDIKKACDFQNTLSGKNKTHCYVWAAVKNPGKVNVHYTLAITKDKAVHFLANGIPTPHNFPMGEKGKAEVHKFAVFAGNSANTSEPFTITTTSDMRGLQIMVNIYSTDSVVQTSDLNLHFPSSTANHYHTNASCWNNLQQVIVSHEDLASKCSKGKQCLLLITVQRDPNCNVHSDGWNKYTITASSVIEKLSEGHPAHGKLSEKQFKYYSFHMPHEKTDIMIIGSNILGNIGIFVSHNKTSSKVRPNINFYDWRTWSSDANMLELGPEDQKDGTGRMDGEYNVMVYCYSTNCTYSLLVLYEDTKIGQFHVREVYDVISKKKNTLYYLMNTWGSQEHHLIITKNYGQATVYAKLWNQHLEPELNVPTRTSNIGLIDLANKNYGSLKLVVTNNTCYYCKWVIAVDFEENGGSFTFIGKDVTNTSPITLPSGKSFVDEAAATSTYSFEIWKGQNFNLDIQVLSGSPTVYLGTKYPYDVKGLRTENFKKQVLNGTKRLNMSASFDDLAKFAHCYSGYWCQRQRTVYIQVDGPAVYRIRGQDENTIITLQDGRIETFHNQPTQRSIFKFVSPHNTLKNKKYNLNIKVTYPYNVLLSDVLVDTYFSPALLGGEEIHKRQAKVERNGTRIVTREIFKQIHAEDGTFYFYVQNVHQNETLDFTIMISSGDIISMTTHDTHNSFLAVGDSEIYEITSNQTGYLGIEAVSCDGTVSMKVSSSIDFSNAKEVNHENYELWHSHQVTNGSKTYVKVTAVEGTRDQQDFMHRKEAGYTFRTSISTADAAKKKHIFAPGNGGELDYRHLSNGEYLVEYSPIVIIDSDEAKKYDQYNFYYLILTDTNRHNLERQAKCGSFYAREHGKQVEHVAHGNCTAGSEYCSYPVNFEKMDKDIKIHYLTVTGWAVHKTTRQGTHVNYQVIEFDVEPSVFRTIVKTPWWAKLLAVVVVLLVVVVVVLMRRATSLKQKLDYEMNDVRNVAGGMPSIPGVGNKTSLTEDKHMFTEMQEKL